MGGCSVEDCKNRFEKGKTHFFRFPRDFKRDIWARFTRKGKDFVPKESNVICEDHFEAKYLIKKKKRFMLDKKAVPTIYWRKDGSEETCSKVTVPYDGVSYVGDEAIKLDEPLEQIMLEAVQTRTKNRLNDMKTFCRLCGEESSMVTIHLKHFESYHINIDEFMRFMALNPDCDEKLSRVVCEECFNQVVSIDLFRVKCQNAEQKLIQEFNDLNTDLNEENLKSNNITEPEETSFDQFTNESQEGEYQEIHSEIIIQQYDESMENNVNFIEGYEILEEFKDDTSVFGIENRVFQVSSNLKLNEMTTIETLQDKSSTQIEMLQKNYCHMCKSVIMGNTYYFQQHKKKCNKERTAPIECELCNKKFDSLTGFTVHSLFHKSSKTNEEQTMNLHNPGLCEICGKSYKTLRDCRTHMRIKHSTKEEIFKCSICEKVMSSRPALNHHKYNSHKVQQSECNICNKVFRTKVLLRKHKMYHDETKRIFNCEYCPGKPGYFTNVALKRHQRSHSGDKPFTCEYCDISYSTKQQLKIHTTNKHTEPILIEVLYPVSSVEESII